MLTGFSVRQLQMDIRLLSRFLLLTLLLACVPLSAGAQIKEQASAQDVEERPLSESVVLTLKLVTKTLAQPTTGIVISDDGLVLVPAGLIKDEGEIVVLDDGVDIAINGRPAIAVDRPSSGGLALLLVEGLERPGIVLSDNALDPDQALHLETFPPADMMAEGAKPLWVPIRMSQPESGMRVTVSPDTPLPYVTGPILDECGYLAGLSLALGPQSMDLDKFPVVVFTDELSQIFDVMQVDIPQASCLSASKSAASVTNAAEQTKTLPEPVQDDVKNSKETEPPADNSEGAATDPGQFVSTSTYQPPSIWHSIPVWMKFLGVFALAILIWKGIPLIRLAKNPQLAVKNEPSAKMYPSAAEEPDTDQLDVVSDTAAVRPRSAPLDQSSIPNMSALPPGCDIVVLVEGLLDADTVFKRYCAASNEHFDIIIGRGDADISIEHPAISRSHARLTVEDGIMTLSDLGSSNGTFINGIPCLAGEIMYTGSDDEIFLGQLSVRISLASKQEELT